MLNSTNNFGFSSSQGMCWQNNAIFRISLISTVSLSISFFQFSYSLFCCLSSCGFTVFLFSCYFIGDNLETTENYLEIKHWSVEKRDDRPITFRSGFLCLSFSFAFWNWNWIEKGFSFVWVCGIYVIDINRCFWFIRWIPI